MIACMLWGVAGSEVLQDVQRTAVLHNMAHACQVMSTESTLVLRMLVILTGVVPDASNYVLQRSPQLLKWCMHHGLESVRDKTGGREGWRAGA